MVARVQTAAGADRALPELLSWQVTRTGSGSPADAVQLCFAADETAPALLEDARRLTLTLDGEPVFYGVVDECRLELSGAGYLATVTGRGLAALLLDNAALPGTYAQAQLADLLKTCVTPWGIRLDRAEALPVVRNLVASPGDSCYAVLAGYCRWASGPEPRFTALGALVLARPGQGRTVTVTQAQPVLAAAYTHRRYGCLDRVLELDARTGRVTAYQNAEFPDGQCRRVVTAPGGGLKPVSGLSPEARLSQSTLERQVLELTLPGSFLAQPDDILDVALPRLGLTGRFLVTQAVSAGSRAGLTCRLTGRAWK